MPPELQLRHPDYVLNDSDIHFFFPFNKVSCEKMSVIAVPRLIQAHTVIQD